MNEKLLEMNCLLKIVLLEYEELKIWEDKWYAGKLDFN